MEYNITKTRARAREVVAEVFKNFEDNFQKLTEKNTTILNDYIDEYGEDKVLEALNIAIKQNKRFLNYVEGILKNDGKDKRNTKKLPTEYTDYTNV